MVERLIPKKPIEEDPVAYLIDLIISFSKTVTRGRGLSINGVKALLLFLLTAGLLYAHTEMPIKLWDIVKLYSIPFIFLLYFIIDLGKNIDRVNRFFKKLQQRTDFVYDNIVDGSINREDLELYLMTLPFSSEQIVSIIQRLVSTGQFTPNVQKSLLQNKAVTRIDTYPLIKDSLINTGILNNIDWSPVAVCTFLSYEGENLPKEYLDKLINKYNEHPSVLFAIGYFNRYKKDETDIYFKMGYEFKYTTHLLTFFKIIAILIMVPWLLSASLSIINVGQPTQIYFNYFLGFSALVFITIFGINYIKEKHFILSIKRYFRNQNTLKDSYVIEKIISDLNEAISY